MVQHYFWRPGTEEDPSKKRITLSKPLCGAAIVNNTKKRAALCPPSHGGAEGIGASLLGVADVDGKGREGSLETAEVFLWAVDVGPTWVGPAWFLVGVIGD